jgi:predicted ATP-grasp superfamily ATP-dependent carboligase
VEAEQNVLIFGASARAAAFSALRAGLQPWCADLFGDADLRAACPAIRVPPGAYPRGFLRLVNKELPGPWLYTGGLENRWGLVEDMARLRPLWGNGLAALRRARSPWGVAQLLHRAGLPVPRFHPLVSDPDPGSRWLLKSRMGAGGRGIRVWEGPATARHLRWTAYFQEYIEGTPGAALYIADGRQARLLGATRQLVGEPWLQAAPFHYCGSVGPLPLEPPLRQALEHAGSVLAAGCGLRGLFGVDFIRKDGLPWTVEVNPRYTASVEVLEHATGVAALALHRRVFDPRAPEPAPVAVPPGGSWFGKAILFARQALAFPEDGPWAPVLHTPGPPWDAPAFADIPAAGERIEARRPVLTVFARADSESACVEHLRRTAAALDSLLFDG